MNKRIKLSMIIGGAITGVAAVAVPLAIVLKKSDKTNTAPTIIIDENAIAGIEGHAIRNNDGNYELNIVTPHATAITIAELKKHITITDAEEKDKVSVNYEWRLEEKGTTGYKPLDESKVDFNANDIFGNNYKLIITADDGHSKTVVNLVVHVKYLFNNATNTADDTAALNLIKDATQGLTGTDVIFGPAGSGKLMNIDPDGTSQPDSESLRLNTSKKIEEAILSRLSTDSAKVTKLKRLFQFFNLIPTIDTASDSGHLAVASTVHLKLVPKTNTVLNAADKSKMSWDIQLKAADFDQLSSVTWTQIENAMNHIDISDVIEATTSGDDIKIKDDKAAIQTAIATKEASLAASNVNLAFCFSSNKNDLIITATPKLGFVFGPANDFKDRVEVRKTLHLTQINKTNVINSLTALAASDITKFVNGANNHGTLKTKQQFDDMLNANKNANADFANIIIKKASTGNTWTDGSIANGATLKLDVETKNGFSFDRFGMDKHATITVTVSKLLTSITKSSTNGVLNFKDLITGLVGHGSLETDTLIINGLETGALANVDISTKVKTGTDGSLNNGDVITVTLTAKTGYAFDDGSTTNSFDLTIQNWTNAISKTKVQNIVLNGLEEEVLVAGASGHGTIRDIADLNGQGGNPGIKDRYVTGLENLEFTSITASAGATDGTLANGQKVQITLTAKSGFKFEGGATTFTFEKTLSQLGTPIDYTAAMSAVSALTTKQLVNGVNSKGTIKSQSDLDSLFAGIPALTGMTFSVLASSGATDGSLSNGGQLYISGRPKEHFKLVGAPSGTFTLTKRITISGLLEEIAGSAIDAALHKLVSSDVVSGGNTKATIKSASNLATAFSAKDAIFSKLNISVNEKSKLSSGTGYANGDTLTISVSPKTGFVFATGSISTSRDIVLSGLTTILDATAIGTYINSLTADDFVTGTFTGHGTLKTSFTSLKTNVLAHVSVTASTTATNGSLSNGDSISLTLTPDSGFIFDHPTSGTTLSHTFALTGMPTEIVQSQVVTALNAITSSSVVTGANGAATFKTNLSALQTVGSALEHVTLTISGSTPSITSGHISNGDKIKVIATPKTGYVFTTSHSTAIESSDITVSGLLDIIDHNAVQTAINAIDVSSLITGYSTTGTLVTDLSSLQTGALQSVTLTLSVKAGSPHANGALTTSDTITLTATPKARYTFDNGAASVSRDIQLTNVLKQPILKSAIDTQLQSIDRTKLVLGQLTTSNVQLISDDKLLALITNPDQHVTFTIAPEGWAVGDGHPIRSTNKFKITATPKAGYVFVDGSTTTTEITVIENLQSNPDFNNPMSSISRAATFTNPTDATSNDGKISITISSSSQTKSAIEIYYRLKGSSANPTLGGTIAQNFSGAKTDFITGLGDGTYELFEKPADATYTFTTNPKGSIDPFKFIKFGEVKLMHKMTDADLGALLLKFEGKTFDIPMDIAPFAALVSTTESSTRPGGGLLGDVTSQAIITEALTHIPDLPGKDVVDSAHGGSFSIGLDGKKAVSYYHTPAVSSFDASAKTLKLSFTYKIDRSSSYQYAHIILHFTG